MIFETLWFRLASLAFGNSVWAAAIVLGGFMGGLAIGNALAARYGHRISRPLLLYAGLEMTIALTGLSLVLLFPFLTSLLAPLFRPILHIPWFLNSLRLSIAFGLLLIPTTAMGATLPVVVDALARIHSNFGWILGRLYGWNTLGAVIGALAVELVLIKQLGIRGAALTATTLNLLVAFLLVLVDRLYQKRDKKQGPLQGEIKKHPLSLSAKRLLLAAFLSGGNLLALEVVWHRFLLLARDGTSLVFAIMLAIVLAGIGIGGLTASRWYQFQSRAHHFIREITILTGIMVILTYWSFDWVFPLVQGRTHTSLVIFILFSSLLMLPVCLLSGMLFTLTGRALKDEITSPNRAAGLLTLSNTLGAMLGSFLAGFILLPLIGMEASFFVLAVSYGVITLVLPGVGPKVVRRPLFLPYSMGAVFLSGLVFFPFGIISKAYVGFFDKRVLEGGQLVELREGLTETALYYRYDRWGEPLYYRLITDGYSMSGTDLQSMRYMKLYVYWPVALHPNPKKALLISYGVGSTAKALTNTRSLARIDVVDISRDILEMSSVVYPEPHQNPLNDERVHVHVEDGRFFLLTTDSRFDLITAEPPPPKHAGIVNLYTREHFQLIYDHLSEGGIATYWLPANQLYEAEGLSIMKAFCSAFRDCSLWSGSGLNWMLVGTRNAAGPVSPEHFSRQWQDPVVGDELRALGLESPAQLGSLFMADAGFIAEITKNIDPLTDNFPLRLSTRIRWLDQYSSFYDGMTEENAARERFRQSPLVKRLWPQVLQKASLPYFETQRLTKNHASPAYRKSDSDPWNELATLLTKTSLQTLPLWFLGSDEMEQEIIRGFNQSGYLTEMYLPLAKKNIAERDYAAALKHLKFYSENSMTPEKALPLTLFTLCLSGRLGDANHLAEKAAQKMSFKLKNDRRVNQFWQSMHRNFGLKIPSR